MIVMALLSGLVLMNSCSQGAFPGKEGTSLFNGKDLSGWKVHGTEKWYVENGELVWETDTKIAGQPLSITGAPRMANNLVVIGNSGGEVGSRG